MIHNDRLFFNVAKQLGIDIKDVSFRSQVEVNNAYVTLLAEQIENKKMIVEYYANQSLNEDYVDALFMKESLFKCKRELLDLCVEYAAKKSYIEHHKNITD